MKLQKLLSLTRKAVDEFNLIDSGDKIAVGVSGGKDSLTMLYALHGLMRFYPNPFTIEAITVDLGHPGFQADKIENLCKELSDKGYERSKLFSWKKSAEIILEEYRKISGK